MYESTYLLNDVLPSPGSLQASEFVVKGLSHRLDPGTHHLQVPVPLSHQVW